MDEESKPLTAFTVGPLGFYECQKNAFWTHQCPCNIPETDGELSWGPQSPLVYHLPGWHSHLFSKDLASHLERLETVFQKLEKAGLKLKPSKYELFQRQLAYPGHVISAKGVATDEGKIKAIRIGPTPTTVTEVQSFLEFMGYYCRFIPKFMQVAQPLQELTSGENAGKRKAAIKWDNRCQQAFDDLKKLCTTAPILAYANFSKPFKLHTDACGMGLGAVALPNQGGQAPMPS